MDPKIACGNWTDMRGMPVARGQSHAPPAFAGLPNVAVAALPGLIVTLLLQVSTVLTHWQSWQMY